LSFGFAEAGFVDYDDVGARRQQGGDEIAITVGRKFANDGICAGVDDLDVGAAYGRPRRAKNEPGNAPGAAPLPDSPALTTTGERVPLPGDRATGTVIGPDVKTAPPPLRPARPIIEDPRPGIR